MFNESEDIHLLQPQNLLAILRVSSYPLCYPLSSASNQDITLLVTRTLRRDDGKSAMDND